jgi:hypothetical protein
MLDAMNGGVMLLFHHFRLRGPVFTLQWIGKVALSPPSEAWYQGTAMQSHRHRRPYNSPLLPS